MCFQTKWTSVYDDRINNGEKKSQYQHRELRLANLVKSEKKCLTQPINNLLIYVNTFILSFSSTSYIFPSLTIAFAVVVVVVIVLVEYMNMQKVKHFGSKYRSLFNYFNSHLSRIPHSTKQNSAWLKLQTNFFCSVQKQKEKNSRLSDGLLYKWPSKNHLRVPVPKIDFSVSHIIGIKRGQFLSH